MISNGFRVKLIRGEGIVMAKKKKTVFQKKWEKYKIPIIIFILLFMLIGWKMCSNPFGSTLSNIKSDRLERVGLTRTT